MIQLNEAFQKIDSPNPSADLGGRILHRIEILEETRLRRTLLITRFGRIASLGALLYTGFAFGQDIVTSDFWQLASLLLTDAGIVMNYFGEFTSSLLETIPAFPIALLLIPILTFLIFQFRSLEISLERNHSLSLQNA
ncbi:MAG: hypothetical protein WAU28_00955 [Candidatus Moraniibacteriota bacterium]